MSHASTRRVLVVDDNLDAAKTLSMMLGGMGYDSSYVTDPREVLDAVENQRPHIAFIDIRMPHLNGWDVARLLRDRFGRTGLCLVALTAYGQAEHHAKSRQAGFDAHLVKPATEALIQSTLRTLLAS